MKRILAFSAAVCLAVSAAGCGDKKAPDTSSGTSPTATEEITAEETSAATETETTEVTSTSVEDSSSEEETSSSDAGYVERDITDMVKNEGGLNYYMSKCGLFTFGISEDLEIFEVDDFDIAFTNGNDSVIGMFSFSGYHDTVKSIATDVISDYEEKYTNVVHNESTVNGVPCLDITADTTAPDADETKMKIRFSALQYGNGDIFYLVYMGAAESQPQLEEYYQQMLNSIEYLGEPLKTEDETFSNKYYTVTTSPMWCVEEKDGRIKIGLNLRNSIDEIYYGISLSPPDDEKNAREVAESHCDAKKKLDSTLSSEIDETEICGYDAFRVTSHTKIGEVDFFQETFCFDKDGKCWQIDSLYPNGEEEEFKKNIQPILESLEIN